MGTIVVMMVIKGTDRVVEALAPALICVIVMGFPA
jgi:hypothetical protein